MPAFPSQSLAQPAVVPGSGRGIGVWRLALLMMIVLGGALLFNNAHYLFATKLYESTDYASDSLFVREAEQGFLLHGHYSRWQFYHPGPALLDTLAVGETTFYYRLHLVPTPFNGQVLMLCFATTVFFSLALSIFAHRLGAARGGYLFFLPLAVCFAVWHYGAAQGALIFLCPWPAYTSVVALLCFVVAVAATASGSGAELPVLVLTGGWMVHNYVAHPLFVLPLTLLAYGGLLASLKHRPHPVGNGVPAGRPGNVLTAGWHAFPRAHVIAALLLALFILPLTVDALHGADSNMARIIDHVRTYHEPPKKFMRSVCYFLTYGSYTGYQLGRPDFGHYSASGMLSFLLLHWRVYALWMVVLTGAPILFFLTGRHRRKQGTVAAVQEQRSFIPWFYTIFALTLGLTLIWGVKQDGPMFYFNAYFDYSIYFCAALLLAAALAVAFMAWTDSPTASRMRPVLSAALWICVAGAAVQRKSDFRSGNALGGAEDHQMAATVERAAATLPPKAVCYVDCHPWAGWMVAIAVALELERLGHPFRVNGNWQNMFGSRHSIQQEKVGADTPLERWVVEPQSEDPARLSHWPLLGGYALDRKALVNVNPEGQRIDFSKDGNFESFAVFGWSPADSSWTWADEQTGLLIFHPLLLPAEAGVAGEDLLISAWSFCPPGKDLQRVVVQFDGSNLGTLRLPLVGPTIQPLHVRISRELWQEAVAKGEVRLQFLFLDARSPGNADPRFLGGAFRSIEFKPALVGAEPVNSTTRNGE
jgi:hypothetical protein